MTMKVVSAWEDGFLFADDVVNAEEEEADNLDTTTTTRYKMEIGPYRTKMITQNGFQTEIKKKDSG